jgi:hypothetical protein
VHANQPTSSQESGNEPRALVGNHSAPSIEQEELSNSRVASDNFHSACDSLSAHISRHFTLIITFATVLLAASQAGYSRYRGLWCDEILFQSVSTQPTIQQIWTALVAGINVDPPLAHVLTHTLINLLGSSPLVTRLTAVIGVPLMMLFLTLTLRRHVGPVYALLPLLLPISTSLWEYGHEGRPYGLMYGLLGASIYFWDRCSSSGNKFAPLLLGLTLTSSMACHFYAVFSLPAFYLAELHRTLRNGKANWSVIIAVVGATASVLFYLPIILSARQFTSAYFLRPEWLSVPYMLEKALGGLGLPIVCFLVLVAFLRGVDNISLTRPNTFFRPDSNRSLFVLALAFTAIPFLGWIAGLTYLKAFVDRYVLHGLIGIFLLFPLIAHDFLKRNHGIALVLLISLSWSSFFYVVPGFAALPFPTQESPELKELQNRLDTMEGVIIVPDPILYVELVASSAVLKERCIYPIDHDKELLYTQQDTIGRVLASARELGLFRSVNWDAFPDRDRRFRYLLDTASKHNATWLTHHLRARDRTGRTLMNIGSYILMEATEEGGSPDLHPRDANEQ